MQQKMISISSKEMRMHDKTSNWFDTGKTTVMVIHLLGKPQRTRPTICKRPSHNVTNCC